MTTTLHRRSLGLLALLCSISSIVSAETTPVSPNSGVGFNHVFKIDVPGSTNCKVESIASGDQASTLQTGSEAVVNGENDIVFRHNIKLQLPQCDCAESESFKSLLYRVNGLEEEVNYLKTQCSAGCCSKAGGVDTSCSGHGTYNQDACSCVCDPGWEGPDCSTSSCPDECNDNGRCVDGKCVCHQGFTGHDCSQLLCPDNCNDKGHCVDGKCVCFPHFTGEDCSIQRCPNDCVGNGRCVDGTCICDEGFFGDDCSRVLGPKHLEVVDVTDVSLMVDWEPVPGAEYYVLTYHHKGRERTLKRVQVPKEENFYMITGLIPGTTYIVRVYAVIKEVQSEPAEVDGTTAGSTVSGIRVRGQTEHSVQVDWDNPAVELDHFRLTHVDPTGHEEEQSVQKSQEARTAHTIVGLQPGTQYEIAVQTVKGSTVGKASTVTAVTEIDAPTNLITLEVTEDTATVTWDRVQAEIDNYVLSYTSADGSSGEIPVAADSSSYRLIGLKPGVVYTIYIWAVKGDKASRKSSTKAETELDAPTNLLTSDETESSFMVSWDRVQADIDGYRLSYSSADGSSGELSVGADSSSYRLTGLRPGVLYTVYIWAVKGTKASRKSFTEAQTELDAPTNLLTRDATESSFRVLWDRVQADIDGYRLTYSSADSSSQEISVGPNSKSYKLTGLKPGVLYTVYIWAVKGNKASRKNSAKATTDIDAPRDLTSTDVTLDSASLTWVPPLADIEGYILTYRLEDGSMATVEKKLGARENNFAMSGLEMGKRYIVTLIAYRGVKRSRVVETIFKTVGLLYPFPMDCVQVMKNGNAKSGIYTIFINGDSSKPLDVYCDMDTDGGGWLMLQRRSTGRLDFMKRWRQYAAGFGDMADEFWLGLDKIHDLTNTPTKYEVRFDLGLGSERAFAIYDDFKVAPSKQKFRLTIGNYRGTAGDAMSYHQGRPWSTVDSDNDIALGNCALTHRGAWWYKNCHLANLNGRWEDSRHSMGVNWEPWKGHLTSLDFTEIKIRPVGFANSRKRRSLMAREKNKTKTTPTNTK